MNNKLSQTIRFCKLIYKIIFLFTLCHPWGAKLQYSIEYWEALLISGIDLIRAIEAMVEDQVREVSSSRDRYADKLADDLMTAHGGSLSEKQKTELVRALRKKNPLNDGMLASDLEWLSPETVLPFRQVRLQQLDRLSTDTHQARTQAAYISTMLRPFNQKYSFHWLTGRQDIEPDVIREKIVRLESAEIGETGQLIHWGDEVAELFRELVVVDDNSVSFKPNGTVSSLSSRTYLQSWLSFIRKNSESLVELADQASATRVDLNQDVGPSAFMNHSLIMDRSSAALSPLLDNFSSAPRSANWDAGFEAEGTADEPSIKFTDRTGSIRTAAKEAPLNMSPPALVDLERKLGLKIEAELPSGEKSSCHFESLIEALSGVKSWLLALEAIWGLGDAPVGFHANLTTSENQYAFSLPKEPLASAAERLEFFIERIKNLK